MPGNEVDILVTDAMAVLADAQSSPLNRREARRFCKKLKNKPQLCVSGGLKLADRSKKIAVRLFGIQILEYYVTHHWDLCNPKQRKQIRNKVIGLMSDIASSVTDEDEAIRESIVRVVVEIIKREKDASWRSVMEKMKSLMIPGCVHGELVMLVLLRLSEDVVSTGQIPVPFYKVTLDSNMDYILKMLRSLIQFRFDKNERVKIKPQDPTARACTRVLLAAVKTMASYLAWAPFECTHVEVLFCLLSCPDVRVEASECLLAAIKKLAVRPIEKPLLVLLDTVLSRYVFPVSRTREVLTEKHYFFLKNVCQILCVFGDQCRMISLSTWEGKVPLNFGRYLDCLLGFTTHSSYYLSSLTQSTWKGLFSMEKLSKDSRVLAVIPKYLSAARTKLLNVGFPSRHNIPSCEYSRIDFVTDVEFYKFLRRFRDDQKQVIELLCTLDPITCFKMASKWLKELLPRPIEFTSKSSPEEGNLQSHGTNSFPDWEAITFPISIHTFLPLLHFKKEYLISVLKKMFEIIEEVNVKSPICHLVRQDACMCIVEVCESHAEFLLPNFTLLFNCMKQLLCDEVLQLTQTVKSTLLHAMVVLINHFNDFEQQETYLKELMAPVSSLWLSEDMQIILADPKSFVSYVGSDLKITDNAVESPTDLNRSGIIQCVVTILGVLRWTQSPAGLEKTTGVVSIEHNCRNPCAEQVLKLLDNLFVLIRTQHNLYFPGVLSKIGELFSKSLNQPEIKNNSSLELPQSVLDVYDPPECSNALERMQGFFNVLYSSCFYILGCACSSLKTDFYNINYLADKIGNSAFFNLEYVPHSRLLCIVHVFLRPLLLNCPPEYYESFLLPVMGLFLTSVGLRLCYGGKGVDVTNMRSKEKNAFEKSKLDEKILTKEVLQLIIDCCVENDKITISDGPSVRSAHHAETLVFNFSKQGTDDNVATVVSDVRCVPNEDATTFVCTTESDDDDSSVAGAHFSALDEKVDKGKESDFTCYVRNKNAGSSVEVSNTCSAANQGAEAFLVAKRTDSVCVLFENIDESVLSSDNIDCEMAAEVPQKQHFIEKEQTPLTKLGICLMKDEAIRSVLLNTSFSALVWKDFCQKSATCLCWPLLQHVMSEPFFSNTVIHLFTKVIKALQIHRHDLLVGDTVGCLAYRIYTSFRPQYIELKGVMRQISNINWVSLDTFDEMLFDGKIHKPDTGLKQLFKDLIKSDVYKPFCEKEQIVDNVPKSSRKAMKHKMSTKLPEKARKVIKR